MITIADVKTITVDEDDSFLIIPYSYRPSILQSFNIDNSDDMHTPKPMNIKTLNFKNTFDKVSMRSKQIYE